MLTQWFAVLFRTWFNEQECIISQWNEIIDIRIFGVKNVIHIPKPNPRKIDQFLLNFRFKFSKKIIHCCSLVLLIVELNICPIPRKSLFAKQIINNLQNKIEFQERLIITKYFLRKKHAGTHKNFLKCLHDDAILVLERAYWETIQSPIIK